MFSLTTFPAELQISSFNEYTSVILIASAQAHHSGNYSCVATNAAATTAESAQLTVAGKTLVASKVLQKGKSLATESALLTVAGKTLVVSKVLRIGKSLATGITLVIVEFF